MPLSRALLLKGLGGLTAASAAAVGAYGAMHPKKFADFFKSQNQINEEQKKKAAAVNEKLVTLGLSEEDCKLETSDFTTSSDYSKGCDLDKTKFQKIKFFDGGQSATSLEGWTEENGKIKLKISNKSNGGIRFLFKDVKNDLTITKSSTEKNEKVTIRSGKETEFKEENEKLVKVIDQALKTKLEEINKKMVGAGLPSDCSFDVTDKEESIECGLDDTKLKAIKFSNKGSGELTVNGTVGSDLKIKVELGDNNDPSFSFTGLTQDLSIYGDTAKGKIVIKKDEKRTFRLEGEKLEKVSLNDQTLSTKLKKFNEKLSTLSLPNDCRFDEAEKDKVLECGLDANKLKAIKFSNKGDAGTLTLSSESVPSDLKVKVEAKDDDADAHFSFTGLTQDLSIYGDKTKGKIVLKQGSSKEFKVVDEKLEKVSGDSEKSLKLGGINVTLASINLPSKCLFDENEGDSSSECELSLDEFKAIKLTSKEGETLAVATDSTPTKMKLKVELKKNEDINEDETIYTLSDLDKKIKFGKSGEEIFLDAGKSYEFEVRDDKLGPKRLMEKKTKSGMDPGFNTCTYINNSNKGTCSASDYVNIIFMNGGTETNVDTISWKNNKQGTFNFWEYQEGFEDGIKFTFTGTDSEYASENKDKKLEQNKSYELKEKENNWCLKEKPNS